MNLFSLRDRWQLLLFILTVTASFPASAQFPAEEKLIKEIDAYKKYQVEELTKSTGDNNPNQVKVISLINYSRKKGNTGKLVQRSVYLGAEITRKCYFNEKAKVFAIKDSIHYDDNTIRKFTYYFKGSKLANATNELDQNVTDKINQPELMDWVTSMFDSTAIN